MKIVYDFKGKLSRWFNIITICLIYNKYMSGQKKNKMDEIDQNITTYK